MDNATVAEKTKNATAKGRRLEVLIIEDVEDDALLLVRHLRKNGFDAQWERVDNEAGLNAALAKQAWDAVLCDHGMAGFSPMAAIRIIRERGFDPPFIVVSGTIGEERAAEVMRAGVHDVILKGNLSRLIPAIERELREAEIRRRERQTRRELEFERDLLHDLMANIPDAIYFRDLEHRYIRLNAAEARLIDAPGVEAAIGKRVDEMLPSERAKLRIDEEKRIFATGEPLVDRIERVPQADGGARWFSASKAPIRDRTGKIVGLVGISRDVTGQKQAEQAIRENEAFFRAIVDYSPGAVVIKDADGRCLVANKTFCDWYASTHEEIVGKTHHDLIDEKTADRLTAHEREVLETKTIVEQERRVAYPDGANRDVLSQKFPILGPGGKLLAVGTVITDITDRKRMEEDLRTKTRQLEVVLETMDQGIYAVDANLKCTLMNRRYAETHDLPPELTRPGVRFEQLARFNAAKGRYGPGEAEDHIKRRVEYARQNRPLRWEFDLRNGHVAELRSNPLPDGGFVRTSTDITERREMEDALRESEERFRAILETLPVVVSLRDRDGRYLVANRTLCSWLNRDAGEIVGKTVFDVYPERDAEMIHQQDADVFAKGVTTVAETRITFPDGTTRDLIVHRTAVRSATGEITAVSNISTDITAIRKAEGELRKYSQAVHQSPSSVIIADTAGTIEYVNQAFTQLTGYAAEEAIGRNPRFLKSGQTPPEVYERMWATITDGKVWRGTFHNKRKDGGLVLAGATVFPITAEDGRITHFVGTQQDITQRVAEQNLLKQAEKMESLGNLAGGIAHDFNNMLLPIIALTDMTLKKLPDDSGHRQRLEKVLQAAGRAKGLVAKILAFSRQEEAKQKPTDVGAIVDETLGLLRTTLPSTISIEEKRTLEHAKVFADAGQIGTALMNLASNAADAMEGLPGRLVVSLDRAEIGADMVKAFKDVKPGAYVRIRVKDNGQGMDEATMRRIFEPFFTTKAVGKGTGLGLATAYGIVTNHGGVIDVASEIGKGATFDVYLPLMEKRAGA